MHYCSLIHYKMYLVQLKEVLYIDTLQIIIAVAAVVVFSILSFLLGISYRKKIAEAEIGSAEEQAKVLVNDAVKAAESKKREILLEAKEETHALKADLEKELKDRRNEMQRQERRVQQRSGKQRERGIGKARTQHFKRRNPEMFRRPCGGNHRFRCQPAQ